MKNLFIIFTTFVCLQGCTVVGALLDKQLPKDKHGNQRHYYVNQGKKSDEAFIKAISSPKNSTGCKELKGQEKTQCIKVSNQINKSIENQVNNPKRP